MTLATIQECRNGPLVQGELVSTDGTTATVRDGARNFTGRLISAALIAVAMAGPALADPPHTYSGPNGSANYAANHPVNRPNSNVSAVAARNLLAARARSNYLTAVSKARSAYFAIDKPTRTQTRAYHDLRLRLDYAYVAARRAADSMAARESITSQGWDPYACRGCEGNSAEPY